MAMNIDPPDMQDELDAVANSLGTFPGQGPNQRPDLEHVPHAFEDLPEEAVEQLRMIGMTPKGVPLRKRIFDVIENAAADLGGTLERVKLLHLLIHYHITPYTYGLDDVLTRGSRPSVEKLKTLSSKGFKATINLCVEMEGGDAPAIQEAGLDGRLLTYQIPITDGTPPDVNQVMQLLRLSVHPKNQPAYVHCEAGVGRTGVMVACYRLAVMGWTKDDALLEAQNFSCRLPDQLAFIADFADRLDGTRPLGAFRREQTVGPTPEELKATVATAAD
jgi:hypothetical protein